MRGLAGGVVARVAGDIWGFCLLRREDYVNDIHVYHTLRLDIHVSLSSS